MFITSSLIIVIVICTSFIVVFYNKQRAIIIYSNIITIEHTQTAAVIRRHKFAIETLLISLSLYTRKLLTSSSSDDRIFVNLLLPSSSFNIITKSNVLCSALENTTTTTRSYHRNIRKTHIYMYIEMN